MLNLFGKAKEYNDLSKEHREIVRFNITEPLITSVQTLLDHSNYVTKESDRFLDLYQFTQSSDNATTTVPTCPRTTEYLKRRGFDESVLLTPSGLLGRLDTAVAHGVKMDRHISTIDIQANISAGLSSGVTGCELAQSSVDTLTQMLDAKKHTRKAGYKGRIESVRSRKQDINNRLQTAIDKLDSFHKVRRHSSQYTQHIYPIMSYSSLTFLIIIQTNLAKLDDELNKPIEVPKVNVNLVASP